MSLANLVRVTSATTGTGTLTLGVVVTGFLTPSQAGMVDGTVYSYAIEADYVTVGDDLVPTSREVGTGTYTVSGTTLTRTVINSTNSNALLNLAGDEQVIITPNAADFFIAATQADQETGSINTEFVTPGIQQFHPSAAKCWGFTIGGGTPVLTAPSYNMTSITDTGVGILTVTIATDFSSANYVAVATDRHTSTTFCFILGARSPAAGSVIIECTNNAGTASDPEVGYSWVLFGDQ